MTISRRGLLLGVLSAGVAPAIVSSGNIMRINSGILLSNKPYKIITLPLSRMMQLGLDYDGDIITVNNGCGIERVLVGPAKDNNLNNDIEVYLHTDFLRLPVIHGFKLKELTVVR